MDISPLRTALAATLILVTTTACSTGRIPEPPAGASARIDAIRQRGTLRVAVLDEYPWLIRQPPGSLQPFEGPAWILAEDYARRLGVTIEPIETRFSNKVSILAEDGADLTIAPLLRTPERDAVVDLVVYSKAAHCVFGLADNPRLAEAWTLDDLDRQDITIGTIAGTPQGAWLQGRLPRAGRREAPGTLADLATDEVVSGRADVAPIDKFFFSGLSRRTPGLVTIPRGDACMASEELPIEIGLAADKAQPEFVAWLRAVAAEIRPRVEAEQARVIAADAAAAASPPVAP